MEDRRGRDGRPLQTEEKEGRGRRGGGGSRSRRSRSKKHDEKEEQRAGAVFWGQNTAPVQCFGPPRPPRSQVSRIGVPNGRPPQEAQYTAPAPEEGKEERYEEEEEGQEGGGRRGARKSKR